MGIVGRFVNARDIVKEGDISDSRDACPYKGISSPVGAIHESPVISVIQAIFRAAQEVGPYNKNEAL